MNENSEDIKPIDPTSIDSKCERKTAFRRTIDYNASVINYLKDRIRVFKKSDVLSVQPDYLYNFQLTIPIASRDPSVNCITSKLIRTATNKNKCPIYCVCWTPESRRLVTGACSGEFTLWNGLTFNFETILQAHESQIRCMKWSHNGEWLLTADNSGYIKYWQANMNNVKVYQAHGEPIRGVSFSPLDSKFVSCSDDSTVRIWDFNQCTEERVLRGHGADVRCVAWHPQISLIISGSKDAQQPIKLWEPKIGKSLTTLYVHKSTCTDVAWNKNGNWFLTASRDHSIKLFDIRFLQNELQTFRGHKRDVMRVNWHPIHEDLFVSGGGDGTINFWSVGMDSELGSIDGAHEGMIWSLAWHPLGHILVSGGNDFSTKFWSRDRPGEVFKESTAPSNAQTVGLSHILNAPINLPQVTSGKPTLTNMEATNVDLDPGLKVGKFNTKLPEFIPVQQDMKEVAFVIDRLDFSQLSIPGINEGIVLNQNVKPGDSSMERGKNRQGKAIPRDFAQNWVMNNNSIPTKMVPSAQEQEHMYAMAVGVAAASVTNPATKRPLDEDEMMINGLRGPPVYRGRPPPPFRGPPPPPHAYYPPAPNYTPSPSKRPNLGPPPPCWGRGAPRPMWRPYPPCPPPIRRAW